MSAKRAMQVVGMQTPDLMELYGYEPTKEEMAKFFFLPVEDTPGVASHVPRYLRLGYEIHKVVCEHPRVTIMRIPHEVRTEIFKSWEAAARDQGKAAEAAAKNSVSAAGAPYSNITEVEGPTLSLPNI